MNWPFLMGLGLLVAATAWAEDPQEASPAIGPEAPPAEEAGAEAPPPPASEDEAFLEVLVIGEQIVSARRDQVVRSMEALGWRSRRRSDGAVVFRGTESWMGKAQLMPTGDLEFTQPVLAFQGARQTGGGYDDQRPSDNDQQAGTVGASATPLPDRRIVRATQLAIREQVQDDVMAYQRAIQGRHLAVQLQKIPERLDLLWQQGEAPDGSRIEAMAERRAWVLDYWATRTATPEGRAVCEVIAAWLRETVQLSEHPVPEPERAAAEARRSDGLKLTL